MIPKSNTQDLMLKEEVVKAVKDGRFHIYTASTIDEGIEVLTGVKAGERRKDGTFGPNTVNERVDRRLKEMAESLARFAAPSKTKRTSRQKKK
jgi:predicted ATP-dependent protease